MKLWHRIFLSALQHNVVRIADETSSPSASQVLCLPPLTFGTVPIMKEHHLSVMTLEEYEPNREFVGRNFNAGEVIQLVLKARFTGRWLPFDYVQMVMMHELAHCKQMNHSRAFWAVRNQYADRMRELWTRGYTGEGLWGRGASLVTGEFENNTILPGEALPEHLCGGTYRSRRRKRKVKEALSYREQKERRILKKFGANGQSLGDDEIAKLRLEGKRVSSKPRVASSKRGRELRAAAALARFDTQKKDETVKQEEDDDEETMSGSETGSDYEDADPGVPEAVDLNGKKILDRKGHGMIKVCEDENPDDQDAMRELRELQSSMRNAPSSRRNISDAETSKKLETTRPNASESSNFPTMGAYTSNEMSKRPSEMSAKSERTKSDLRCERPVDNVVSKSIAPAATASSMVCPVCSFENENLRVTCGICSHVLDAASVPGSWQCNREACKDSRYLNAGDCGVCGICGERRRQ